MLDHVEIVFENLTLLNMSLVSVDYAHWAIRLLCLLHEFYFYCDCVKQFVNSCVKELCGDDVYCRALRFGCFLYEPIHACLNV